MPTYRQDVVLNERVVKVGGVIMGVELGASGVAKAEANESRVSCPKCGSPFLAAFVEDEARFGGEVPDFVCTAGDCDKVNGPAKVSVRSVN